MFDLADKICQIYFLSVIVIKQSSGFFAHSSWMILPTDFALISPEIGFLIDTMSEITSAFTVEYSKQRSQSFSNVQFIRVRSSA